MIRPDDDMLRALAAGVYPPTEAEARAMAAEVLRLRERTERAEAEAEALASEVLRLRSIVNAARTSLRDYHDSPSGSAHIAWDALCGALGVDGGGR